MAFRRFNKNQPRDRRGRWSKGGSSGSKAKSKSKAKKSRTVYTQYTSFKRDGTVKKSGPIVAREIDSKGRFKSGSFQKAGVSAGVAAGLAVGIASGVGIPVAGSVAVFGAAVGGQVGYALDERARIKNARQALAKRKR